jgi:CheY-like chemotaxis protein
MPRILLIDDDELLLQSVAQHLESDGHNVLVARHGGIGLRLLEIHEVDLIITDLVMPEVEGMEFLMAVRRMDPTIPVIAITGALGNEWSDEGRADYLKMASGLGATRTLRKPFTPSQMRALIADCLKK